MKSLRIKTRIVRHMPIRHMPDGATYRDLVPGEVTDAVARPEPGQPTLREVIASLYNKDE